MGGGRAPPPASLAKVWASRCPWRAGLVSPAAEREPHVCPEAAVGCLPPADPAPSLSFLICQAWGKRFLLGRGWMRRCGHGGGPGARRPRASG